MLPRRRALRLCLATAAAPMGGCLGLGRPSDGGTDDSHGEMNDSDGETDGPDAGVMNRPVRVSSDETSPSFQVDETNSGTLRTAGPRTAEVYWRRLAAPSERSQPVVVDGAVYVAAGGNLLSLSRTRGETRWNASVGHGTRSTPAVAGGTVYATTWNGDADRPRGVVAVDAAEGDERWRALPNLDVTASPTVTDNRVYVGGGPGNDEVAALDAASGEVNWRVRVSEYATTPAVADGTVFVGGGTTTALVALEAADGAEAWRADLSGRVRTTPTLRDGVVYAASADSQVYALDAADGAVVWKRSLAGDRDGRSADVTGVTRSPAVDDGMLYVPTERGMRAYATGDGSFRWSRGLGGEPTAPVVADGSVYLGVGRTVRALDALSGENRWSVETRERTASDAVFAGVTAPPAVVDGVAYVVTRAGDVYALGEE